MVALTFQQRIRSELSLIDAYTEAESYINEDDGQSLVGSSERMDTVRSAVCYGESFRSAYSWLGFRSESIARVLSN